MIETDLLPPPAALRRQRRTFFRGVRECVFIVALFIGGGSLAGMAFAACSESTNAADYYEHSHGLVYDPCGIFGVKPVGERCAAVCGDLCPDGVVVEHDMAESEDSI